MSAPRKKKLSPVLVRTHSAGVHYGYLVSRTGKEVTLTRSRRIWYWKGAASLSQLAIDGPKEGSKIAMPVDITLTEAIEVIDASKASSILDNFPVWRE